MSIYFVSHKILQSRLQECGWHAQSSPGESWSFTSSFLVRTGTLCPLRFLSAGILKQLWDFISSPVRWPRLINQWQHLLLRVGRALICCLWEPANWWNQCDGSSGSNIEIQYTTFGHIPQNSRPYCRDIAALFLTAAGSSLNVHHLMSG